MDEFLYIVICFLGYLVTVIPGVWTYLRGRVFGGPLEAAMVTAAGGNDEDGDNVRFDMDVLDHVK